MKKLTKIKLVNWHLFSDETIPIKDNTLISGENGSGKSTLLDAMQYLLVGGKAGTKFNIAATDDAKRTLEGYVRGRIGAENKEFLRTKDVVTHICLEFFDERKKTYSIIGAVLALPVGGILKERLYMMEDIAVEDHLFLDSKKHPRDFIAMKAHFKTLGRQLESFESQKKYRESLSKFFGLDARKYSKVLPKALAFRSIDLQKFVFDFLLDDDPIDIQSLKNNVAQLKKVEAQIKSDREKLEKLDKISEVGEKIGAENDQIEINKLLNQINFIDRGELMIKSNDAEIENLNQQFEDLRSGRDEIDKKIVLSDKNILEIEKAKYNNDATRTIEAYQEEFDKKDEDYKYQKEIVKELNVALETEYDTLKELAKYITSKSVNDFIKYYNSGRDNLSPSTVLSYLSQIKFDLERYSGTYTIEKAENEKVMNELSVTIGQCRNRLYYLQRNVKTYSQNVIKLIEVLTKKLTEKYQKEVIVRPLAELLEVNDEKWRNALEGFLNTQRFDIIVDPKYFDDALEIYDKTKNELGLYGVGLVNTNKLDAYSDVSEGSLSSKVSSDHKYARLYANMLLNQITCVDDVHELKNHSRAITASCMAYLNHTARQINPRVYETPYIGLKANEIQVEIEKNQLRDLEYRMVEAQTVIDKDNTLLNMMSESKCTLLINQNQLRYLDVIKQTRKELAELEEQLSSIHKNSGLIEFDKKLEEERAKKYQYSQERDQTVSEIGRIRGEMARLTTLNEETKERLQDAISEQKRLTKAHPEMLSVANEQYSSLKSKMDSNYKAISKHLENHDESLKQAVSKQLNEITNLMKHYCLTHHFSAEPEYEHLVLFETECNNIRNNNLVKYEYEATELRKNSEIGFREEFVNKLRACIENAQQQISELNFALQGKTFGSDSYQLTYKAADSPEYKVYYDIIMSNAAFEKHTLFTENLSRKNEHILMELFEKIASSDPQYDKISFEFLDYRNYMSYDIEITNKNGNKSFFSKVSKEKSGGETQVPFYIVIAASFQSLLSKNKNTDSGCVVLFDEAFNNMDESRIDAMMKFYNSLSIQLFIAVPPQRVPNIISYINTTVAIVKENDYATVAPYVDSREKE